MWYFAINNERKGPVDPVAFEELVAQGVITPETLVWKEGMANWQRYAELAAGQPVAESPAPAAAAAEAGETGRPKLALRQRPEPVNRPPLEPLATTTAPRHTPDPLPFREYGGFWIRLAAKFIDGLVTGVVVWPLSIGLSVAGIALYGEDSAGAIGAQIVGTVLGSAVGVLYNGLMVGKCGATVGKMACGLRVVTPDGAPVSLGRAFGRAAADLVTGFTCGIGYVMAAFDDQKRALHDYLATTRVVRKG